MAEVEMVIDSLRQSPVNHQWVVILKEKLAERYLPVYIGSSQGFLCLIWAIDKRHREQQNTR